MLQACFIFLLATITIALDAKPVVHSLAGIFQGRHLSTFNQDVFLGIQYAKKPIRFTPSVVVEDSPSKSFDASSYGTDCWGFGSDTDKLVAENFTTMGEDCLNLNIIRPGNESEHLPVLLWIYGGGWFSGATSDPR